VFKSIKRLLIAGTAILALSAPSAAFAYVRVLSAGDSTSGRPPALIVPTATSPQGFQWSDAGIGAAGMVVLLGAGAGVATVMRRRTHRPVVG
jgi:hypothetical protein